MVGAALGLKETVICVAVGIGVFTLLTSKDWRAALKFGALLSIGILVGYIATYGWWAVLMYEKFNSPLFPLYNEYFRSTWAQPLKNDGWNRSIHGFKNIVLYPFRIISNSLITGVVPFRQLGFAVLELYFPVALVVKVIDVVKKKNWRARATGHLGALTGFFLSAYLVWCWTTAIYRYVVVMEMLTPLLIYVTIRYVLTRFSLAKLVFPVAAVVLIVIAFSQQIPDWGRTRFSSSYFSLNVPTPLNDHHAAIVIVGDAPSSFVIPYFSQNPSFIRAGATFPLYGKMQKLALTILGKADHVFVMWGDYHVEDNLTWKGVTTLKPYPSFLAEVHLGTTSMNCSTFNVVINGDAPVVFHYCEIR